MPKFLTLQNNTNTKTNELFFGRELEYKVNGGNFADWSYTNTWLQNNFSYFHDIIETCEQDLSIPQGFEIVLHPFTMEFFNANKYKYEELFRLLNTVINVYVDLGCGGHVHIGKGKHSNYKFVMQEKWLLENRDYLYNKYEWIRDRFGRRFVNEGKGQNFNSRKQKSKYFLNDKYFTIARRPYGTFEHRYIRTPKNFTEFIEQMEFLTRFMQADIHNRKIQVTKRNKILDLNVADLNVGDKICLKSETMIKFDENVNKVRCDKDEQFIICNKVWNEARNNWAVDIKRHNGKTYSNITRHINYFYMLSPEFTATEERAKIVNGIVL